MVRSTMPDHRGSASLEASSREHGADGVSVCAGRQRETSEATDGERGPQEANSTGQTQESKTPT